MPHVRVIPRDLLEDRLRWLAQVQGSEKADPHLLITGLQAGEAEPWSIGVVDARVVCDKEDQSPYIVLTFGKPGVRRSRGEASTSERWFDPEAAFILQAHLFYGNRLSLQHGRGSAGGIYHYPVLHIARGGHYRYALRLIVDVPRFRLGKQHPGDYHDLRRRWLGRTITSAQAARMYGRGQKHPSIVREDVIKTSIGAWRRGELPLKKSEYQDLLLEGYRLLDLKPLRFDART